MNFFKTAVFALGLSTLALAANAQQNPYDQNPYGANDPSSYPDTSYDYSPTSPDEAPAVDVGFFYQELAPYGEGSHPMYGCVFLRTVIRLAPVFGGPLGRQRLRLDLGVL